MSDVAADSPRDPLIAKARGQANVFYDVPFRTEPLPPIAVTFFQLAETADPVGRDRYTLAFVQALRRQGALIPADALVDALDEALAALDVERARADECQRQLTATEADLDRVHDELDRAGSIETRETTCASDRLMMLLLAKDAAARATAKQLTDALAAIESAPHAEDCSTRFGALGIPGSGIRRALPCDCWKAPFLRAAAATTGKERLTP